MVTFSRMRSIFFTDASLPSRKPGQHLPAPRRATCRPLRKSHKVNKRNYLTVLLRRNNRRFCPAGGKTCRDFGQSRRERQASELWAIGWLGSQNLLNRRILQNRREGGVHFNRGKFLVAFVFGFAQVDQASLQIPGLGKRFRQQEIKSSAVTHGAVLKNRPCPRTVMLEQVRIHGQRLPERCHGLLVFLVLKIGKGQVAV